MKFLVILSCFLAVTLAAKDPDWDIFKAKFNRKYKSLTEEAFRKKIFLNNKMAIDKHNQLFKDGKTTFTLGINQFADLTTEEFASTFNSYKRPEGAKKSALPYKEPPQATATLVDWRSQSTCVTPVKDQGQCGSCWAFSSTGSTEFYNCKAGRQLTSLSEQNLVDCCYAYGNGGCNGGWMDSAFQYIRDNGGIDTEASYPYEAAGVTENCRFNAGTIGGTLSGYNDNPTYDENALANNCALHGVIAVAIDASHQSFQLYSSGTYYEALCDPEYLDHAVLVVGYGTDDSGNDYWIVKNSWGASWGMEGYINMSRNRNNNCGIASAASWPEY